MNNPLFALLADINRRSNVALDMAEAIQRSSTETLEPGEVDRHGNTYSDPEFKKLDKLAEDLNRQNIVYIHGVAYELASWGEAYEDGSRQATLRVWRPF